jgi:Cytochrome c554 and c-prime
LTGGALVAALAWLLQGAAASPYAGAQACRLCHSAQFERQSASGHARTLYRAAEHPLAARFAAEQPLVRSERFRFTFREFRVQLTDGQTEMEIPIQWAFGSGTHGVTFVSRLADDSYLEHAFSYYSDTGSFDLTPGHRSLAARTLPEAAGQVFRLRGPGFTIRSCFQCHSTGPVSASERSEIQIAQAGVRCEACHGPGRAHVETASRQSIRNPRSMSADDLNRFCGLCHRSPDGGDAANDFTNPWNVRHQPPYLEQSRCFRASAGALSCLTCHAPHEPLRRNDPKFYSARCAACHRPNHRLPPARVCRADAAPDCTACHMPLVAADPHLKFRNHWIGVYRGSARLMPSR